MRIAILGGTFNPVHVGHLSVARAARSALDYDRILFVPANIPAHKRIEIEVGPEHRLNMLKLAIAEEEGFGVDDCELRRGGRSYTIDTVEELRRRWNLREKPGLIIGDDLARELDSWKNVERLTRLVELVIARRCSREHVRISYPCRYLDNPLFPVSSSAIRRALQAGEPVDKWLPPVVYEYIEKHGLYR